MSVIPRLRASVVCPHQGRLLTVRAVDPVSRARYLFLPGGGVEEQESPVQTAERETLEETGYRVRVDPASEIVLDYAFNWSGRDYDCRSHFFRAELIDPAAPPVSVVDDGYLLGVEWVSLDDIQTVFNYHDGIRRVVLALA